MRGDVFIDYLRRFKIGYNAGDGGGRAGSTNLMF